MSRAPIADGHGHTNPVRGVGAARIARRFKEAGGWFQALVALSPWHYALEFRGYDSYVELIDIHIRECKAAEDEGLKVACIAGFHPADVDHLIDRYHMKPVEVLKLGLRVVDYVAKLCSEGVLDGIGEVGRQHYKTMPERVVIANLILERALEHARDNGCVVHMHLENAGTDTVDLTSMAVDRVGVGGEMRSRIFFHHVKPVMAARAYELGYSSTIPGLARILEYAFTRLDPVYIVESDYIDDPARPGAVVYPWEMASTQQRLASKGLASEEYLYRINVDNVVKVYGIEPP
ncbi:MAG: TatD family hydrolase [Desulfurococcales archaeon]|nr:TatD family hydrolase [Desulfurococcales archaeon]